MQCDSVFNFFISPVKAVIHTYIIKGGTDGVNFLIPTVCIDFDHLMTSKEVQKVKAKAQYTDTIMIISTKNSYEF